MENKLEIVSELIHNIWCTWANTILEQEPLISQERRDRWAACMIPYSELSEDMKDKDRNQAKKIIKLLEGNSKGGL